MLCKTLALQEFCQRSGLRLGTPSSWTADADNRTVFSAIRYGKKMNHFTMIGKKKVSGAASKIVS
jgi:hypothetical protein